MHRRIPQLPGILPWLPVALLLVAPSARAAAPAPAQDIGAAIPDSSGRGDTRKDPAGSPGGAPSPDPAGSYRPWSLEDCLEAALTHSTEVVQKQLDVGIARAQVAEASAARLPHFTWQTQVLGMTPFVDAIVLRAGTYGEISIPTVPNFGSTTYIPPPNITVFDGMPGKYITTAVQMVQPLYTGGKIVAAIRMARLNHQLALGQLLETAYQTAYYVKQLYLGIQLAEASRSLLDTMRQETTQILEDTRSMRAQGLVATSDVLEAEAGLKQLEEELANTTARLVEARESLRLLTGATRDDPMTIAHAPPSPAPPRLPPEETLVANALARRPVLRSRQVQQDIAKANVAYRKGDRPFRPVLGLSVEYGARGDRWPGLQTNWTMEWDDYYTAAAQLQVNLFDGGESAARVRQARLKQQKAAAGLEQTRSLVVKEVRQARAAVESAWAAVSRAEARVAEHEEKHRSARLGFEAGTLGRAEYLAEYMAWCQARTEQLLARFNLEQARLSLELATGALPRSPEEVRRGRAQDACPGETGRAAPGSGPAERGAE